MPNGQFNSNTLEKTIQKNNKNSPVFCSRFSVNHSVCAAFSATICLFSSIGILACSHSDLGFAISISLTLFSGAATVGFICLQNNQDQQEVLPLLDVTSPKLSKGVSL